MYVLWLKFSWQFCWTSCFPTETICECNNEAVKWRTMAIPVQMFMWHAQATVKIFPKRVCKCMYMHCSEVITHTKNQSNANTISLHI